MEHTSFILSLSIKNFMFHLFNTQNRSKFCSKFSNSKKKKNKVHEPMMLSRKENAISILTKPINPTFSSPFISIFEVTNLNMGNH